MRKSDEILAAIDEATSQDEVKRLRGEYRKELVKELRLDIEERELYIKAIDAQMSGKVSDDIAGYELWTDLGKRSIDKIPVRDLLSLRKLYVTELSKLREKLAEMRGLRSRQVLVRF